MRPNFEMTTPNWNLPIPRRCSGQIDGIIPLKRPSHHCSKFQFAYYRDLKRPNESNNRARSDETILTRSDFNLASLPSLVVNEDLFTHKRTNANAMKAHATCTHSYSKAVLLSGYATLYLPHLSYNTFKPPATKL
jgi:hypothetical protein